MYFPFFQREHKVHHHILSAGFFALLFIHAYLGIDALLAGPTVMQKTGKINALERQSMSYKELAREARKLIISARKKGKTLKLVEAMHIVKNGVYNGSGVTTALMKSTASGQTVKNEDSLSFSSAPSDELSANEIFGGRVTSKKKNTTSTSGSTGGSTPTTTSGGSSGGGTSTTSGGSTGGSSTTSTTTTPTTTVSTSSTGTTATGSTTASGTTTTTSSGTTSTTTSTGSTTTSTGAVASTGTTSPSSTGSSTTGSTSTSSTSTPSSTSTMISIGSTENPQIKKLSDYQKVVGGFVSNQLMVFLNMPESAANIEGASYYMANTANEFAKYGITPIFVIEPYGDNGQLDLGKIKNGDYIAKLDSLFALLKGARGLTEDKLGILVPYPEINTPAFDRTNFVPSDLPILVNQYFDVVRKYYPNARGGLLLDGKSYDTNKTWGQGEYKSYSPYISGIKSGYISHFGIQGFPWVSNDGTNTFYNPSVFLPISLGVEAANMLSTKNIWFNTGTMRKSYKSNTVYTTPEERSTMMNGIINQGKALQDQGYSVMIHIFAENKFQMGEGIDWSYIDSASDGVLSPDESVFSTFISGAKNAGISVGLFDM